MNARKRLGMCGVLVAGMTMAMAMGVNFNAGMAGPPLICQPYEIGDARTLDLPSGGRRASTNDLPRQVQELLTPSTPVIVRMETLRRAVVAGAQDPRAMTALLSALQSRVLDAEAASTPAGLAWFDAAFFAASWDQMDGGNAPDVGVADGAIGYAWMKKAIAASKDAPEMEFAAALLVHPAMRKGSEQAHEAHLQRAVAGAKKGSLLEQNVKAHCENWSRSYEALKSAGARRAADTKR